MKFFVVIVSDKKIKKHGTYSEAPDCIKCHVEGESDYDSELDEKNCDGCGKDIKYESKTYTNLYGNATLCKTCHNCVSVYETHFS